MPRFDGLSLALVVAWNTLIEPQDLNVLSPLNFPLFKTFLRPLEDEVEPEGGAIGAFTVNARFPTFFKGTL